MNLWGDGGLYGAWLGYLDRWSTAQVDLAERPPALRSDDFDSSTWYRLMLHIQEAVNVRLQRWQETLVRNLNSASDEFSWGRGLVDARRGLKALLALTELPELTDEIRRGLRSQIEAVIKSVQSQLEDDAQRALRQGTHRVVAEMQLRQLRRSSLLESLAVRADPQTPTQDDDLPPLPPSTGTRRRQILID